MGCFTTKDVRRHVPHRKASTIGLPICVFSCSTHTHALVMAGRVAVVVLLVVVFVGALGLGLAFAKDCVEPDVVVKEGEEKKIYQENETQPQNATSISLYVKPGDDFEGFCVKVEDETLEGKVEHCFNVKSCNLSSANWTLVTVEVKVVPDALTTSKVESNLTFDSCVQTKNGSYKLKNIARLSVSVTGASEWLLNGPPDPCLNTTTTENSPSSGSLPTYVIIVAGVAGGVVAAVTVGVIIWKLRRRPSAPETESRSIQSTGHQGAGTRDSNLVIENSLYEPLPGRMTPAARQEQPGTVQVIENSLYEPLPGRMIPAARQEQPGTVQVIENSLYEPLPGRVRL
ncbi:uncharacterized protein LOC127001309 [Eriocheir sinensis]|uniref:uncharacterized protein LOC127001309 n=1 Tax=Eriocheir sinensis TaxID=95602 RepID=UPI0021C67B5D|nr:uncharacterized protein LOC127001309 [Eriocheir sinensis]